MNNEIINEETELLCYRLRTKRQKTRAQRKGFEKELRALDRERSLHYSKSYSLGWVELNPPIMRGWKRFFVLRDDVARSKDAGFFEGILKKINTVHHSTRKDFKKKARKFGKKIYLAREQHLNKLDYHDLKRLRVTDKEFQYFEERKVCDSNYKKMRKIFVFTEPWRFVLKIKPNIITKVKVVNRLIESRLSEIDNRIESHNLQPKIDRLKDLSYRYWKTHDGDKAKYLFKKLTLNQMLDAAKEDEF